MDWPTTLQSMFQSAAAAETWQYLQAQGCTHAVYDVTYDGLTTHYAVVTHHGHVVGFGVDASEGLATSLALMKAVRVVSRGSKVGWTQ